MDKCKYPNEICANMTMLHGIAYCDSVPCILKEEIPKQTNADWIRGMGNSELAEFLYKINLCCSGSCMIGKRCTNDEDCKDCFEEWLKKEREG